MSEASPTATPPPVVLRNEGFFLASRQPVRQLAAGIDPSLHGGGTGEYQFTRDWQPGDSIRSIDWRVFAATGQLSSRRYDDERLIPALLAIDQSDSMTGVSSRGPTKYHVAIRLLGGLLHACLTTLRPVSVIGSRRLENPMPTVSRTILAEQLTALHAPGGNPRRPLAQTLDHVLGGLPDRRLLVVLTDLNRLQDTTTLESWSFHHEILVVVIEDLAHRQLRRAGFVCVEEAETGNQGILRAGWKRQVAEHRTRLEQRGLSVCRILPTEDPAQQLRLWLENRRARSS